MTKPHTAALLAAIARWRRIEAAAREMDRSTDVYSFDPCRETLYRQRQAMEELHRVITEEKP